MDDEGLSEQPTHQAVESDAEAKSSNASNSLASNDSTLQAANSHETANPEQLHQPDDNSGKGQQIFVIMAEAKKQNVAELSLSGLIKRSLAKQQDDDKENAGNDDATEIDCPPQICELTSLTKLNLSDNALSSLPPLFGLLSSLTELDLSKNLFFDLPSSVSRLTSLRMLDISHNRFITFPEECCQLPQLTVLRYLF